MGFAATLIGVTTAVPANATVAPNGSFSYSTPGPNTVDTTNIASTTMLLTIGTAFPGSGSITSFVDPFLGNPNNFCGSGRAGCTAAHSPGFLFPALSSVDLSNLSLPVGNTSPVPISETVTASTGFGGLETLDVDFDYTSIFTAALTPTTSTSVGSLTLDFAGTFASDNSNQYTLGQAADMSLTCTQRTLGAPVTCNGTIDTPRPVPAPLIGRGLPALLAVGGMLFGAKLLERSKTHGLQSG
jgi:hypothetical protein